MTNLRIGISGWNYPSWRAKFYPAGLPHRRELEFAASQFNSIEVNASFYRLQKPETYRRWTAEVPDDFVFALKGSRYITHMKRLESTVALANFLASGVLALGHRLGPMLWQLPARLSFDAAVLEHFVAGLPTTTTEAASIAAGHDERLRDRAWFDVRTSRRVLHALEVRHESFRSQACYDILRRHNIALVIADSAGHFPQIIEATASFQYVRLHGAEQLYTSGYDDRALRTWARRITGWREEGQDVYVYFDNDALGHAPFDALRLAGLNP